MSVLLNMRDEKKVASNSAWNKAMNLEIEMIEMNKTWDLVEDKTIVGVKWVFKTTLNLDGTIQKHKARLVAKS